MNESIILAQLKQSDKAAFSTIYKKYWSKVYDFTKLYIMADTEVEEIVQEVFIKVWENRESIDEDKNFEGYLFIVTRNLIFNLSRKSFNNDFYKVTIVEAIDECYEIEDELAASDLKQFIDSLIEMLPPRQKEVFKLSREEHLSYKEIAARLDLSEKTIERHINEALKFLRKNIHLFLLFSHF